MTVTWMGPIPSNCDVCGQELKKQFVDGKTQMGPWGIMCLACLKKRGVGLGTGRGQLYDLKTGEKVRG